MHVPVVDEQARSSWHTSALCVKLWLPVHTSFRFAVRAYPPVMVTYLP
ncbi:MAG: hypothetical protein IPG68_01135 [Micrococcales bacterium]|nr:hypothetical protein [Micrococcales bacterium]